MKYCPSCQIKYADETLRFCLQDGTGLLEFAENIPPTQHWSENETVARNEAETVVRQQPLTNDWTPARKTAGATVQAEPKKNTTVLTVLVTALAMSVIFGGIILGVFLLKGSGADNKNIARTSPTKTSSPTPTKTNERSGLTDWDIDYNSSLNGERITYYRGTTVEACQADCADNPGCVAFTLIRAGAYNEQDPPMCYLMAKVTSPSASSCCISGIRKVAGKTDGPPPEVQKSEP